MIEAAIGGALIGVAAVWLLASLGRIAGISGIVGELIERPAVSWALWFVVGLGSGGWLVVALDGRAAATTPDASGWVTLTIGGLLAGFGTRLGSGCTSGHGVCGMARLSRRSIAATATFLTVAMVTATVVH
jgi:uncharacterized membrane protein YedE/YeeE